MTNMIERIHNEILNVSYSKLFDIDIPWNSAEVFECACKLDFDGIKGDVTPTKDGKLIMCHDAEFWFDENGRVYKDRGRFYVFSTIPLLVPVSLLICLIEIPLFLNSEISLSRFLVSNL